MENEMRMMDSGLRHLYTPRRRIVKKQPPIKTVIAAGLVVLAIIWVAFAP